MTRKTVLPHTLGFETVKIVLRLCLSAFVPEGIIAYTLI